VKAVKRESSSIPSTTTVRELCDYLKVHPTTIYRLLKQGQLPGFRVSSGWRFNVKRIDRWRVEREKKPDA
jgi:excisionase family DNA binding protein